MTLLGTLLLFVLPVFSAEPTVQPTSCKPGEHWVRAYFRRAYIRRNGESVRATNVSAHCQTSPKGYSFWEPKLKSSLPTDWPYLKKEVARKWSEDERERLLESLAEIPSELWSDKITGIYQAEKSINFPNPASSKYGSIVVYGSAFEKKSDLARIVAHELSHQKYRELNPDDKKSYQVATSWWFERKTQVWLHRESGYVEKDGMNSVDEDFANNIEAYLYEPEKLRKITPNATLWIRNYFGDTFKLGKDI